MHVAPGAANSQNMEHAVQISTVILRWSGLAPSLSRQELPNEPPPCVRQIPTRQNRPLTSSLESRQTRFGNPVCQHDPAHLRSHPINFNRKRFTAKLFLN